MCVSGDRGKGEREREKEFLFAYIDSSSENLVPEPGEVVDSQLVLAAIDTDKNVVTFNHFDLRKLATGDQ